MVQQVVAPPERTDVVDEYETIAAVIRLYFDGCARGEPDKISQAFHPESQMIGSLAGQRYDEPLSALVDLVKAGPADTAGRYRGRILAINQVGDAAGAIVAEDGFWGSVSFIDFFNLAKIDGRWWIVNKTFAHTGGEPPAS